MLFIAQTFIQNFGQKQLFTIMKTGSNPKNVGLLQVLVRYHLSKAIKVMLTGSIQQVFDRFWYNFDLSVVVKAHGEAVKGLLKLPETEHLHSVLVECHTAVLTHLGRVCVLVWRTHLQKDPNDITHAKRFTSVNDLTTIYNGAIGTAICNAFVPAKREGMIECVDAETQSDCRSVCNFLLLLFVLLQDIVHEKCPLEDRTLEESSCVSKAAADSGLVCQGHIRRHFEQLAQRNRKVVLAHAMAYLMWSFTQLLNRRKVVMRQCQMLKSRLVLMIEHICFFFGVIFAFLFILQIVLFAFASCSFLRISLAILKGRMGRTRIFRVFMIFHHAPLLHLEIKSTNQSKSQNQKR